MWVLVVLSLVASDAYSAGKGSRDECVQIAKSALEKHSDTIKKAWCVPEADWNASGGGLIDENEVHS
jgi:hypothetical protein